MFETLSKPVGTLMRGLWAPAREAHAPDKTSRRQRSALRLLLDRRPLGKLALEKAQIADQLFTQVCTDEILCEWMTGLPLARLMSLQDALVALLREDLKADPGLYEVVFGIIRRDWRGISLGQAHVATDLYLKCLLVAIGTAPRWKGW